MTPLAPNPWGERRRLRVGLLGGSFNPAHEGHRHIAELALRLLGLDQVWLLVSPQNPLKPVAGMAPLAARVASAQAVTGSHPRLRVSAIESVLGTRFTADTLAELRRRFPRTGFVWLMGQDNLLGFHRWRRWREVFQTVPVAILARGPYSARSLAAKAAHRFHRSRGRTGTARHLARMAPPAWVFLHTRLHPASSTAIRAARDP